MDHNVIRGIVLDLQDKLLQLQAGLQTLSRELYSENEPGFVSSGPKSPVAVSVNPPSLSLFELHQGDYRFTKPVFLIIGESPSEPVRFWKDVVVRLARWMLKERESVGDTNNPIIAKNRSVFPDHGGDPNSYLVEWEGHWIDTWGNVNVKVANLMTLFTSQGVDPATVKIGVLRRNRPQLP